MSPTRVVTGTVLMADLIAYPSSPITFTLLADFIDGGVAYLRSDIKVMPNATTGYFSVDLAVPSTGTAHYLARLLSGTTADLYIAAGPATDLATLITIAGSPIEQSALQTMIDAHVDSYLHSEFNVKSYGATGDGVTDDTAAIQAAIDAAGIAGGGIVYFPPGTYLLTTTITTVTPTGEVIWHLSIVDDNIQLYGSGASSILKTTTANAHIAHINGAGKPNGIIDWLDHQAIEATVYPLDGTHLRDAISITLNDIGDAANFAVGDMVFIRTGQLGVGTTEPDSEINQIVAILGAEITLRYPLCKDYAQEYYIAGTTGLTSTDVTANPAPFGIANVDDVILHNIAIHDLNFISTANAALFCGGQIDDYRIEHNKATLSIGFMNQGIYRGGWIQNNNIQNTGIANIGYAITTAYGCSDIIIAKNMLSSVGLAYIHIHEGSSRIKVLDNTLLNAPTASSAASISIRARGYGIAVLGNHIINGSTSYGIFADDSVTGGIIVDGNTFEGDIATPIAIAGSSPLNVLGANNLLMSGSIGLYAPIRGVIQTLVGQVGYVPGTNNKQASVILGTLSSNVWITNVRIYVKTGFDAGITNKISVGVTVDHAQICGQVTCDTDWTILAPTVDAGVRTSSKIIQAYYEQTGSAATKGLATVIVEYIHVPFD